jgi:hypothetical protein
LRGLDLPAPFDASVDVDDAPAGVVLGQGVAHEERLGEVSVLAGPSASMRAINPYNLIGGPKGSNMPPAEAGGSGHRQPRECRRWSWASAADQSKTGLVEVRQELVI